MKKITYTAEGKKTILKENGKFSILFEGYDSTKLFVSGEKLEELEAKLFRMLNKKKELV